MSQPRGGKPRKLSEDNKNRIMTDIEKVPHRTVQDLHINLCAFVCETTFCMALREAGRQKWKSLKRRLLLPVHVAARLE